MTYTLAELAEKSGTTARTIRYYISQGLLSSPVGKGRTAHYTEDHLRTLTRIKGGKDQGLPLENIQKLLEQLELVDKDPDHSIILPFYYDFPRPPSWKLKGEPPKASWNTYAVDTDVQVMERVGISPDKHNALMESLRVFKREITK